MTSDETSAREFECGENLIKRLLDVTFAVVGLLLLSPLWALAAFAVRLDSPGPVLFRQTRLGFDGRPFRILKFRSMTVLEDGEAVQQARRNDQRITPVGRWLRRTSIDELPQLLNVLRGDMSLVGPRPHALAHANHFAKLIVNYALRHQAKPGLTGWAQVNGYRGETPTVESMRRRVESDIWYVENWSVWLDLRIILRTAGELFRTENAY
jgi:exopolysaccharide biosynthesis polyprenyl glycosylphosphotransferase